MQTFTARVRDMSLKGLGVVDHPDGRVFFAPGVWPGDLAEFRITSVEKRYGFAEVVQLLEPSPERVEVACPYQGFAKGRCGGCPWMMARYEDQLRIKQKHLEHQLHRVGAISEKTIVRPVWGSPRVFGYRNRAQFKTDGQRLGFVSRESREMVDIEDCLVLTDRNRQTLKTLRAKLPNPAWQPAEGYQWSFVEIDDAHEGEIVPNRRLPFRQGNDDQNARMKEWLQQKVSNEARDQTVIELFAGSGNFTEVLVAQGIEHVLAAEVVAAATDALAEKNWPGVQALTLNLYKKGSWKHLKAAGGREARILVLDPPREGFEFVGDFLREFKRLERIFYIACEVSHFARDAARIRKAGYELLEIQPLDQFPHTPYVEVLAEFARLPR